jgi:putative serine protease PepD
MPAVTERPRTALVVAGLVAALALGLGLGAAAFAVFDNGTTTVVRQVTVEGSSPVAENAVPIGDIYARASKAVVEIAASGGLGSQAGAQGSGFVYDEDGHIVTNQHVVAGASRISVSFWNGAERPATVVGTDPSTDLAVLHVDARRSLFEPLHLASSSAVRVGDQVLAFGSPFGLEGTVTSGIVSALHRSIQAPNDFTIGNSIQTDAPINHGNSGGPLLDGAAQVIGVNAQIQSDSGGNDGVGFAIPSNTVRSIVAQLVAGKSVQHAYLGVSVRDSRAPVGAELARVFPGTPAAKAGLKDGDVITAIDGRPIAADGDVSEVLGRLKPGDTITVTYSRGGHTSSAKVTLTLRPS